MPMSQQETILEHIKCSHAALDAAVADLTKYAEAEKRAADLIPAAVDALIKHERIDPADREKAAAALKDPARVLEILVKTADAANTIRPKAMGGPAGGEKTAAAARPRYVGERSAEKTAADLAFEKALMGG